jgi:hypothetical protein
VVGSFKLCIDDTGAVKEVTMLRSTRLPRYDDMIQRRIKQTWRYSPFLQNGVAKPVCTAITFIYQQR